MRTITLLLVVGVAEAIPNFGPILSLIGGSTTTMMTFILPCVFYMRLKKCPLYQKILHVEIIIVAMGIGACATYSAIVALKNAF